MSLILYVLMIILWGLSWIAIKWQGEQVAMEVSIFYRFAIAAGVLFLFSILTKRLQLMVPRDHIWCALQGGCLFCLNFMAFYAATSHIPSGLVALLMATAPLFNCVHGRLFYRERITQQFIWGTTFGLFGVGFLFAKEITTLNLSFNTLQGVFFSLVGTWCFSMGNMISIKNTKNGIKPLTATAYSMLYGCVFLLIIIYVKGHVFTIELTTRYIGSLLYLAIPASVFGFTVFLVLVNRVGANNSAYILVFTPIVALMMSSFYENYVWTMHGMIGFILICLGNVIARANGGLRHVLSTTFKNVKWQA